MKIKLDYHSSEPLYWQAVMEFKRLVVTKRLKSGDKLPSVRVLAEQLQLNATTIRRIFDQLASTSKNSSFFVNLSGTLCFGVTMC